MNKYTDTYIARYKNGFPFHPTHCETETICGVRITVEYAEYTDSAVHRITAHVLMEKSICATGVNAWRCPAAATPFFLFSCGEKRIFCFGKLYTDLHLLIRKHCMKNTIFSLKLY